MDTIISAAITGGMALIGVIITNLQSSRKMEQKLERSQAVTECRLEELTREVREHNNFARRMPVVEEQIRGIHEKIHMLHPQERAGE
ncbi:MAG: hypothetical protein J6V25_08815 [Oscillospiraceae bacterium]|nr:hypothetical protein [Oscillospiraceae bacterium]